VSPSDGAAQREASIVMDDGVVLAATLYLPDRLHGPQPCILEALPYRKDDLTAAYRPDYARLRDEYSYAVCRLDLRGTGSSAGDATDEYPAREQRDLHAVIEWLAAQEWCDGSIGMYGTSYSGFNSLQMACERPDRLKAVIAIYATDDRYTDDVHYRGGIPKLLDLVDYCHYMTPMNALPPVPARWGGSWRAEWRRRIETTRPWLFQWLDHQLADDYWRHGSVRPDYDRIACPTMIIAGWADGYRNNSFRTIERLRANGVPHRLLAGPWAHAATDTSLPGPRIDSMPVMAAWWDRWLRDRDNGVDDGLDGRPGATCFIRSSTRPSPVLEESGGEWVREEWPCPRVQSRVLDLDERVPYPVRPDVGTDAWIDCAGHLPYGQSGDQRFDDAASLSWDWDPQAATLLGHPRLTIQVAVDGPAAYLSAKLCDVFPDGTSALVSRGTVNLALADGLTRVRPIEPGRPLEVTVELDACAYRFEPGQRLRLSIAGADWPNTAAPPGPAVVTVLGGRLELPCRAGDSPHAPPRFVAGSESGETVDQVTWRVERDVLRDETTCVIDHGSTYDARYESTVTEHYSGRVSVNRATFEQHAHAGTTFVLRWPEATVSTEATMDLVADADSFDVSISLVAREGAQTVGARDWRRRFKRVC
jgi:predicted acyl esterase